MHVSMLPVSPPTHDKRKIRTPNWRWKKPQALTSATAFEPPSLPILHTGSWCPLLPRDGVLGVGCRPRSSDHRLAVTGGCASIVGLCAPSSMLFCLLGASRQQRGEAPPGWEESTPPRDAPPLKFQGKCSFFLLLLPFSLAQARPRPFGLPCQGQSSE